jgi:DNA-binding response OmpR family regulator
MLIAGPLRLRPYERDATIGEEPLLLRSKEFLLLESLLRRPGRILSRTVLCERVWGSGYLVSDNTIDVTVSSLRSRLADTLTRTDFDADIIGVETVRGMGYRFVSKKEVS